MDELHIKYKCPDCRQAVLNRRISHCLFCGGKLPVDFLITDDKVTRLVRDELNGDEFQNYSFPAQVSKRQKLFHELTEETDPSHLVARAKKDERSDGIRAMDALVGGLIGFVICFGLGMLLFKRGSFNEMRASLFVALVFGGTLLGAIGSWLVGTEFWTRLFYLFSRK